MFGDFNKTIMLKRPPSRTQRPKGINVKHVLQVLLLLGVCFWLIYQMKHSHDKEEYDENESNVSVRTQTGIENVKLGRKDLTREEVTRSEKQPDEEEEEEIRGDDEEMKHVEEKQEKNKDEEDDHEEENKHKELEHEEQNKQEMDEQEEPDNKGLAAGDEGNEGGDDEIIERDQEKIEETEHDDEFVDEEKEREHGADEENGGREGGDSEGEDKERDIENESSSDDQDLDGGNLNNHEAREEHYKADDASSAVSHDIQTKGNESQKGSLEDQKQNSEREVLQWDNQSNNMVKDTKVHENSGLTVGEGDKADNGTSLVLESSVRKDDESCTTERGDILVSNLTLISTSDNQPVVGNTLLEMSTEASKNSGSSVDSSGSSMQITETMNITQAQNASDNVTIGGVSNLQTVELEQANNSTSISDRKQSDSTVPTGIEIADATASNSSNWEANIPDDIIRSETTTGSEIDSGFSSTTKENPDASQNEKVGPQQ